MALLYFKVKSDYEQVIKLREEIERLKATIKTVDANKSPSIARSLVKDVTSAQKELRSLETAAAKAGFTVERDFKSKILEGSKSVNELTSKIITQRDVVRGVESDVKRLSLAYSSLYKGSSKTTALTELNSAKKALQEEKNALFGLQQERSKAGLSVRGLKDEYSSLTTGVNNSNTSLRGIFATIGGAAVLQNLASKVIDIRAEMEMLDKSFEVLLGSKEKADAYMIEVKDFALKSPLSVSDVSKGAQTLLGFNIEAEKTIPIIKQIGDISMGDSGRFSSLILAFSQMSAAGKLMGQDLNQMISAGFNPLMYISEKTGKSIAVLRKDMESGAISSQMVADAFDSATKQGGKFYGMTDKISQGVQAARNQLQGAILDSANAFGEENQKLIVGSYNAAQFLVENYDHLGRVLVGLIGTYGVYKVALIYAMEAEKGYTLSQIITTRTLLLTEKAQKALNLAILKNPYAIAAVAIVTLIAAMWALSDSTTSAEKAQKKFNEEQEKNIEVQEKTIADINERIAKIKNETETEQEKIKAYIELKGLSKALTEAYSREKLALMSLADINKIVNEERDKNNYGKLIEDIDKLEKKIKSLNKEKERGTSSSMVTPTAYNSQMDKRIKEGESELALYKKEIKELDNLKKSADWQSKISKVSKEQLQGDYDARQRIIDKMSTNKNVKTGNIVGGSLEGSFSKSELESQTKILKEELEKRNVEVLSYNNLRIKLEKDLSTEEAKLASIRSNKSGKMSESQFNEAIKTQEAEVKKRKDALEAVIGSKTEKEETSAIETQKKISELKQKQSQEKSKLEIDLQYKTEQAKIDAMKDGAEKTLLQMSLEHKKELEALELEKSELLVKKRENAKALFDANPKNKGKVFSGDSSLTSEESSSFSSRATSTKLKQSNEVKKYYEDTLKEFATFEEKKATISKEYDDKIRFMEESNTEGKYDKNIEEAKKQELKALYELELANKASSSAISKIFATTYDKSYESLKKLKEEAEGLLAFLKSGEYSQNNFGITEETFNHIKNTPEQMKSISDQTEKLKDETEKAASGFEKIKISWEKVRKMFEKGEKNEDEIQDGLKGIQSAANSANSMLKMLANSLKEIADYSGSSELKILAKGLDEVTSAMDNISQGVTAGSMFGPTGAIIGGSLGALTTITSLLSDSFNSSSKRIEELKEIETARLQTINDYNIALIEQNDLLKQATSVFGVDSFKAALSYVNQLKEARKGLYSAFKGTQTVTNKGRGNEYISNRDSISDLEIKTKDGWKSILSMYPDILDAEKGLNLERAKAIIQNQEMNASDKAALQNMIDYAEKAETALSNLDSYFTDVFGNLGSGLMDAIDTSLEQGTDAFEAFGDNVGDVMSNIIDQIAYSLFFADKFKDIETKIKAIYTDENNTEEDILKKTTDLMGTFYGGLSKDIEASQAFVKTSREEAKKYGIDIGSDSSSQSSTSGGFQSMSQDMGGELNGRFTALSMTSEESKNQSILQTQSLNVLSSKADSIILSANGIRDIADEMRTIQVNSYLELRQISENTGAIIKPIKAMAEDIAIVKKNTSRI